MRAQQPVFSVPLTVLRNAVEQGKHVIWTTHSPQARMPPATDGGNYFLSFVLSCFVLCFFGLF